MMSLVLPEDSIWMCLGLVLVADTLEYQLHWLRRDHQGVFPIKKAGVLLKVGVLPICLEDRCLHLILVWVMTRFSLWLTQRGVELLMELAAEELLVKLQLEKAPDEKDELRSRVHR